MTIPAKLQSYMACGMPILAVAAGETKRIIEEAACGWVVPFGEEELLADVISGIVKCDGNTLSQMRKNALVYCNEYFNKEQLLDVLTSFI